MQIAEPPLIFSPTRLSPADAGDIVDLRVLSWQNFNARKTSAFQYQITYEYSTIFFHFNESAGTSSAQLLINNELVPDSTPVANVTSNTGTVTLYLEEMQASNFLTTVASLRLTNEVVSGATYEVPFRVSWNSLPSSLEGGRPYDHMQTFLVPVTNLDIVISYFTSDPLTPDKDLQVQEEVFLNVTVHFSEVSYLT